MSQGKTLQEVVEKFIHSFFNDCDALNIVRARAYPRATDHIPDMIAVVAKLMQSSHVYASNGSVYFDVSSYPSYGQLSRLNLTMNLVDSGSCGPFQRRGIEEKRDPRDFVLWKGSGAALSDIGGLGAVVAEPCYYSEFGMGRPGTLVGIRSTKRSCRCVCMRIFIYIVVWCLCSLTSCWRTCIVVNFFFNFLCNVVLCTNPNRMAFGVLCYVSQISWGHD
jgi:hypothetical protein